mgnify:CR=1 FL=1
MNITTSMYWLKYKNRSDLFRIGAVFCKKLFYHANVTVVASVASVILVNEYAMSAPC